MSEGAFDFLTPAADLIRVLKLLKPGQRYTVRREVWRDIMVPAEANPLNGRMTTEERIADICGRMWFKMRGWEDIMSGSVTFERIAAATGET